MNAILRGILASQNIPVQAQKLTPTTLPTVLHQLVNSQSFKWHTHLLHHYTWDQKSNAIFEQYPQFCVGVMNLRDPRDCAVSLAHLHDQDIETAAKNIANYHGQMRFFRARTNPLMVRYEHLVANKSAFVDQIALHMGFNLQPAQIRQIDVDTSFEKMRDIVQTVADGKGRIRSIGGRNRVVRENPDTFITDRHIQSGKSGRWLEETTAQDQAHLNEILTPIAVSMGYHANGVETGKFDA